MLKNKVYKQKKIKTKDMLLVISELHEKAGEMARKQQDEQCRMARILHRLVLIDK